MLEEKTNKAISIVNDALQDTESPFVIFTGGKNSLIILHLVKRVSTRPVSVLFIDTSVHFNEVYRFVEKIQKLWGLSLITKKNEKALGSINIAEDKVQCCALLKEEVLRNAIKKYGIDCLFTGLRNDEQEAQGNKKHILQEGDYMTVNPIVHFSEKDVWDYIYMYNLPYCSLYNKGFKSIDCAPCTKPTERLEEHSVTRQDNGKIAEQLRRLGYF